MVSRDSTRGVAPRTPTRPLLRRLLAYRAWLREGKIFTAAWAAEQLEISERTVLRDMDHVRYALNWSVEFDRRRNGFILTAGDLPLPCLSLKQGEWVALLVGEQAVRQYAGTPYADALQSALRTLVEALDAPMSLENPQGALPHFTGPPPRPVEPEQFAQLAEACREHRRLEIVYHSMNRNSTDRRRIDPYHLFAYGGDWLLIAFDHLRGDYRTFALGTRIRSVKETGETFHIRDDFHLEVFLARGFRQFHGGVETAVTLRFSPMVARYLREKVWDETEVKEELPDGGLLLKMRVPISVGLTRFILQYGAAVEVLEPPALREQIREELAQAVGQYPAPSDD